MKKYTYNTSTGRYEAEKKHLSPSDVRRREARKAERSALAEKGVLTRQPSTFTCFVNRLDRDEAIFESKNSQQDLNDAMCMASTCNPVEATKGRLAVGAEFMETMALELIAKGWVRA
jgi:hypothetical protein